MNRETLWRSMLAQSFHPRQWFEGRDDYQLPVEEESIMWVYRKDNTNNRWLVGFYAPNGDWNQDSTYGSQEQAANRVHWLNGGSAK